jgi:hypothetical protein
MRSDIRVSLRLERESTSRTEVNDEYFQSAIFFEEQSH